MRQMTNHGIIRLQKSDTGKLRNEKTPQMDHPPGRSHPAGGRAYDFLWRVGPRFSYKLGNYSALGLTLLYAHASNGMNSHNPGYEMKGVNLDFEYKF